MISFNRCGNFRGFGSFCEYSIGGGFFFAYRLKIEVGFCEF